MNKQASLFTPTERELHYQFRATEFPQLKPFNAQHPDFVYADWAGAALVPRLLLETQLSMLSRIPLGNPHSRHFASETSAQYVEQARKAVLSHIGATEVPGDEYDVIFTTNATAAILLLNQINWSGGELLMLSDNHNSVNGLRMSARAGGARAQYSYINKNLTIDFRALDTMLEESAPCLGTGVFAYPLKSNYSGIVHDVHWVRTAQELGWKVLLDVSSYLPNHRLNLKELGVYPDFMPMSFYKIAGFPSGVGALVARKSALERMNKRWFSGGSIIIVSVGRDWYLPEVNDHRRYEDGTLPFASIPMVTAGLSLVEQMRETFPNRAHKLATALRARLAAIPAGKRKVVIHTPENNTSDTVAFNVYEGDQLMDPIAIEKKASDAGIWFRSGCLCNPGCNEAIFGYTTEAAERAIERGQVSSQKWEEISPLFSDTYLGTIRVSFGLPNNEEDVATIASFFEMLVRG